MKTIGMDIGTTTVCAILADAETGKLLNVQTLTNDAHLKSEKAGRGFRIRNGFWSYVENSLPDIWTNMMMLKV